MTNHHIDPSTLAAECEAVYAVMRDAAARGAPASGYRTIKDAVRSVRAVETLLRHLRSKRRIIREQHPTLARVRRFYVPEVGNYTDWTSSHYTPPPSVGQRAMRDPDGWLARRMSALGASYEDVDTIAPEVGQRLGQTAAVPVPSWSSAMFEGRV